MSVVNVPFTTKEWNVVKECFCKSGDDLKPATDILTLWKLRQGHATYLIFQITDHLLTLDRLDAKTNKRDELQLKTLLNNYAAVIVRVINYIHDICLSDDQAPTLAQSVKKLGIPGWIVDIRHSATHKFMPKLCSFRKAAHFLRSWLYDQYWSKSLQDAMKWAVPKATIEGEMNRKRLQQKKSIGYNLIADYVKWRNDKPDLMPKNLNYDCLNAIAAFMQKEPDVIIALLASDVLVLSEEKAKMYEFDINAIQIWDIPPSYQLYWSPLISLIYHNYMMLPLIKVTTEIMFTDEITEFERIQLAGWIDLYIQMMLKGKQKVFGDALISEWRPIIKTMLNQISYFKEGTFIDIINKSGIFEQKKIEQLTKLIKLRTRDSSIKKYIPSIGDNTAAKHLVKTKNNLNNFSSQINNSLSRFIDVNEACEFCISDVDFTNVPLGLMPDQTCETLYLILD